MEKQTQPWEFPEDTVELIDKEPGIISNAMITEAYLEMKGGSLEAAVDFDQIEELRLEFYDIMRIDHLNMCTRLTKLSLSNNVIKEIGNLGKLVNLVSLNLSFNRINQIKGLEYLGLCLRVFLSTGQGFRAFVLLLWTDLNEKLVKLEELTLFKNEISVVENLDKQATSLRLLSLGCNKLHSSSCLIYLRRFKKLSSLNLEGNPFVEEADFNIIEMISGILPNVDYYNYRMIRPPTREKGRTKLRSLLSHLEDLEAKEELQKKMDDFKTQLSLYLEKAFISGFRGDEFFERMMTRDYEGRRLDKISGKISKVYIRLKEGLKETSTNIVQYGVSFYNQRKHEVQKFKDEYTEDMLAITHQSTVVIRDFMTDKLKLLKVLVSLYSMGNVSEESAEMRMRQAIICDKDYTLCRRKAWWDLMEQEMLRHDKNENNLVVFEDKLVELGKSFIELAQVEFMAMRNLEEEFFVSLSDQVNQYLVELHMTSEPKPIPEPLKSLLLDKGKRGKLIERSHKNHLDEIEREEEKLLNKVKEWQSSLIHKFCMAEIERNRQAIIEINKFISHHKKDWTFQTEKALSNAYSFMKSIDPNWTHELIRIKMSSKERMMDDQIEALFRERYQATAMRKRMEIQVKEEQGLVPEGQEEFKKEERKELDARAKRKAYRFAYAALMKRDSQIESIFQLWNSAEELSYTQIDATDAPKEITDLLN